MLIHVLSIQIFYQMSNIRALTIISDGIMRVLKTQCGISKAISKKELLSGIPHPEVKEFTAVWDTGASSSAISLNVVNALGLIPTGKGVSETAAGPVEVDKYSINILLPMNVGFSSIQVSCNRMNVDVLIGMDIISSGDFCITNKGKKTVFTFQTPSSHTYDFKKEIEKYTKIHESWIKQGNNKCPCGSGKKWDQCHG